MEVKNIYETFQKLKYDPNIWKTNILVMRRHQLIPKYYLFSSSDRTVLLLNYATGSGKSLTGVVCVVDQMNLIKISKTLKGFDIHRPTIVGEWMSEYAFKNEMIKPIFNFCNPTQHQKYLELSKSDIPSEKEKALKLHAKILSSMNRYANFIGYQSLFNLLFPAYAKTRLTDVSNLIRKFKEGRLTYSESYLHTLENSTVIVDECQKLYSQDGLNTYGFALMFITKHAKELNIKIILMTGTIFNSSIVEIASLMNIMNTENEYVEPLTLCNEIKLGEQVSYTLKPDGMNRAINFMADKYIFYAKGKTIKEFEELSRLPLNLKDESDEDKERMLIAENSYGEPSIILHHAPPNHQYPDEYKMGNTKLDASTVIWQLKPEGTQKEFLDKLENAVLLKYDNEDVLSPFDAVLPDQKDWEKHGIMKDKQGIFFGSFLRKENIKNYSRIGAEIVDLCLFNSLHKEKTILYHQKRIHFGLLQYGKILEANGFVRRNAEPKETSICKKCGRTLGTHDFKACPEFKSIFYEFLVGDQNAKEREFIVNQVYNNPNNLYGDLISVLLISDVAYAGVSLLTTNNLAILSRVPNMAKIHQIQSRIIRLNSHKPLPDKKYVKLYIYGVQNGENPEKSIIYDYYMFRVYQQAEIQKFQDELIKRSIGTKLLYEPSKVKISQEEQYNLSRMVFEDSKLAIKQAMQVLQEELTTSLWSLKHIIKRIKDPSISVSFLNLSIFSDKFIERIILSDDETHLFKFPNIVNSDIYIQRDVQLTETKDFLDRVQFDDITNDYSLTIDKYIKMIEIETSETKQRIQMNRLMELLTILNDFSYILGWKFGWDYLYKICDEYYDDDEANFISNHSSKQRNQRKMAGFYWEDKIIKKDGSWTRINHTFVNLEWHPSLPFKFKLQALTAIHVLMLEKKTEVDRTMNVDLRKIAKGVDCLSQRDQRIIDHFPEIFKNNPKLVACSLLIPKLCDEQLKHNSKFLLSPFERTSNI